jgi:hypothetical protein
MIVDLYEIDDMHGFLNEFQNNVMKESMAMGVQNDKIAE